MKATEITAAAKRYAEKWNEFRLTIRNDFTKRELRELAKKQHLPYYNRMASYIFSDEVHVTEAVLTDAYNNISEMKYRFNATPIHYSVLVRVIEYATNFKRTQTQKVATDCTLRTKAEDGKLALFSDAELVTELRKRGFDVTAKKTIEL